MKRFFLVLLMMVAFCGGIWHCQEARAEWVQTQSLVPGKYMLCVTNFDSTFQVKWAMAQLLVAEVPVTIIIDHIVDGYIIEISDEYNVAGIVSLLNAEPVTKRDETIFLFRLEDNEVTRIKKLPFRWYEHEELEL